MDSLRFRPATTHDDRAFFREMEFLTTWESLDPTDQERLTRAEVRAALNVTHDILLERPGNRIIIAEDAAGVRVGLLWFGIHRNMISGEEEAWVYNVSVVPGRQGAGIGRQLMEHAEEMARGGGFHILGLMVSTHNLPAIRLYEKLAFRTTNQVMRKQL